MAEKALKNQTVRYVGTSDIRSFTLKDWQNAGVTGEGRKVVTWDVGNGWTVSREDLGFLSDQEFDRLIVADKDFRLEAAE